MICHINNNPATKYKHTALESVIFISDTGSPSMTYIHSIGWTDGHCQLTIEPAGYTARAHLIQLVKHLLLASMLLIWRSFHHYEA